MLPVDLGPAAACIAPPAHSHVLWSRIRLAEGRLYAASDRFWQHPALPVLFPRFLVQLHHTVRGGLALMAYAAARAEALPGDPVAAAIAPYLRLHIEEEQDHAGWLLRDLAVLGVSAEQASAEAPAPAVVSLIGEQFYWIAAVHPVILFGYLVVLEGSPPLAHQLDAILARTALPADAFRCLRAHGEDDPAHLAELHATLDSLQLTAGQQQRITLGAFAAIDAAASLLDGLLLGAGELPAGQGAHHG